MTVESAEGTVHEQGQPAGDPANLLTGQSAGNAPADKTEPGSTEPVKSSEGTEPGKEQDADKGDKSEKVGAPEEYKDFTLPEGIEANKEVLEAFKPMAKELGLTQEQAQALVTFQAEQAQAHEKSVAEYYDTLMTTWQTEVKQDKEIGGQAFNDSIGYARAALDALGTPELREALETTGMGNHPEFVRVFARMGKAIKDDNIRIGGTKESAGPKDPAHILYPNQK